MFHTRVSFSVYLQRHFSDRYVTKWPSVFSRSERKPSRRKIDINVRLTLSLSLSLPIPVISFFFNGIASRVRTDKMYIPAAYRPLSAALSPEAISQCLRVHRIADAERRTRT